MAMEYVLFLLEHAPGPCNMVYSHVTCSIAMEHVLLYRTVFYRRRTVSWPYTMLSYGQQTRSLAIEHVVLSQQNVVRPYIVFYGHIICLEYVFPGSVVEETIFK